MVENGQRGVTRAYVLGLLAATLIIAAALVSASWGLLSFVLDSEPVETEGVPLWFGIIAIFVCLGMLGILLWRHAIMLLQGRKTPAWGIVIGAGIGAYFLWCLCGILGGLSVGETWLSPYAALLAPIWVVAVLVFWLVLARRVYTDRPTPRWPWERREEQE